MKRNNARNLRSQHVLLASSFGSHISEAASRFGIRRPQKHIKNDGAVEDLQNKESYESKQANSSESSWRYRGTFDLYARLSLLSAPLIRAKHTLVPVRFLKLKTELTAALGGSPELSFELKALDVFKYRLDSRGGAAQLRVQAPLQLRDWLVDVVYERRQGRGERVRVAFRYADAVYAKIPHIAVGVKSHTRLFPAVKTTLLAKFDPNQSSHALRYRNGGVELGAEDRQHEAQRTESIPLASIRREQWHSKRNSGVRANIRNVARMMHASELGVILKVRCHETS